MAQVLGESGRYVSQEAVRKRRNILILALSVIGTLCVVWGILIGLTLHAYKLPPWTSGIMSIVALLVILGVVKWFLPKLDGLERERLQWLRGANGENLAAHMLEGFPNEFRVINDLTTPWGNLDHFVVVLDILR